MASVVQALDCFRRHRICRQVAPVMSKYLKRQLNTIEGFLNDIIAGLWPNINIAGSKMVKDMGPSPCSPLCSLAHSPRCTSSSWTLGRCLCDSLTWTSKRRRIQGIKLDMDLDWDGQCDVELDAKMMPRVVSFSEHSAKHLICI